MVKEYIRDLKTEFRGYNRRAFLADLLAGVTVSAVALPLALAFGVSSGADASSGLITAIFSAFIIGALAGASFQISGPTGAMAVILVPMAVKYGLPTVFVAGFIAGIILIFAGIFRAGKIMSFVPKSVITGFTSGIAVVIALGQVENLLGVKSSGGEAYHRVFNIFYYGLTPNFWALGIGLAVMIFMFAFPKKWSKFVPISLIAVVLATIAELIFHFNVETIGEIPRAIIHDTHLTFADIFSVNLNAVLMPAISISALCMIESLMCGAVGGKMKGERIRTNRELVAQGVGNMFLPFVGGVPATAAIARTSVGIKSGGRTRLTGIIHGVILLGSVFIFAPLMAMIPLSALAGVLMVVAWRMNDFRDIKFFFSHKFRTAIVSFLITLACTIIFDLTIAIAVGVVFGLLMYAIRTSHIAITVSDLDPKRLDVKVKSVKKIQVIYIMGEIFFGSIEHLRESIMGANGAILVLSMRGVPDIDASGIMEFTEIYDEKRKYGTRLLFCCVQPNVKKSFDRAGFTDVIGRENFFWDAKTAIASLGVEKA